MTAQPAVLAVDVGNSKTDLALVAADGTVLGAVRGPSGSHQAVGLDRAIATLRRLAVRGRPRGRPRRGRRRSPRSGRSAWPASTPRATSAGSRRRPRRGRPRDELLLRNDVVRHPPGRRARSAGAWRSWPAPGRTRHGVGPDRPDRPVRRPRRHLGRLRRHRPARALRAAVRGRDGRGPRTIARAGSCRPTSACAGRPT